MVECQQKISMNVELCMLWFYDLSSDASVNLYNSMVISL